MNRVSEVGPPPASVPGCPVCERRERLADRSALETEDEWMRRSDDEPMIKTLVTVLL